MAEVKTILDSLEGGQIILIEDSTDVSGLPLLQYCAHSQLTRGSSVHIACLEQKPRSWSKQLATAPASSSVCCYDGYSDPLAWDSRQPVADRNGSQVIQLPSADVAHLEEAITGNVTSCDGHRSVVIVDALSCLLRGGQSVSACCRVLKRLSTIGTATTGTSTGQSGSTDSSSNASTSSGTNTSGGGSGGVRVFVLLHGDLHSESVLAQLRHISNSVFSLSAPPTGSYQVKKFSSSVAAQDVTSVCDMTHRRVSGKITKETCLLAISSTLQLHTRVFDANAEDDTTAATATAPGSTAPDPTANLTFNLRLTSKEKEARSNVVLPYTQVQKRDRSVAGGPSSGQLGAAGGGQIYYQPDDADDFDEEDPDDDLDI